MIYDTLIKNAVVIDGTGQPQFDADVAILDGKIACIEPNISAQAQRVIDAEGLCLSPGFIDVHTHDDMQLIEQPDMLPKVSQGITTVIVGNCGISASPLKPRYEIPDPLNLLGLKASFRYPTFADYVQAVEQAKPKTNVAALIGHTTLRTGAMDELDRPATDAEISTMKSALDKALASGAIGLSSGLAYATAIHAPTSEMMELVPVVAKYDGMYVTHLRSEFEAIIEALKEAFDTADSADLPLVVSHIKCAGKSNWGRSEEVLDTLHQATKKQDVACDCYPYAASSSTLDLSQVTDEYDIFISWSDPHPEVAGNMLADIASEWNLSLMETAQKLQPAGAVYHCMHEGDVERFLSYDKTMVGSDGLPDNRHPHPRLWGAFPRVIKHYCREKQLFDLPQAIHKMTGLSAEKFRLPQRGAIRVGHWADLVLFDFDKVEDVASYTQPQQAAKGIQSVWVNGEIAYANQKIQGQGHGQFIKRSHSSS
ncbi:D-aminoacylase [Alteromonadaceae bacterium M269]|nr:D-aminoacylase [Alteromonadaceae bacterium M269]